MAAMDVFAALADPTRRRIVELLAAGDLNAGHIANNFSVSRPAVSKHLRLLRESGLLASRGVAQQRIYSVNPAALTELARWAEETQAIWSSRLARLDRHVEELGDGG
jgi:DNA-binding transcriptional ArsR family regulator